MTDKYRQRLFASTRGRIIALLRRKSRTVNELAEAVGLTDNGVRVHLLSLERDGLVQQSGTLKGVRRPNYAYRLTEQGEQLFPKAHWLVLDQMLQVTRQRTSQEVLSEILEEVGHRLAAPHIDKGRTASANLQYAADVIGEFGGLAEVEDADGQWTLRGSSCPFAASVVHHLEICGMAGIIVSDILGVEVEVCCEVDDRPRCCFRRRVG